MRPLVESPWRQRCWFFLAGMLFAMLCGILALHWMRIVPYTVFNEQPDYLKALKKLLGWLPWITVAMVFVLRLVKGPRIRAVSYLLGTATPIVVLGGWLILGDVVSDFMHRKAFDPEPWRSQMMVEHDEMWPPRLCMVDSLFASKILDGLSSAQVIELLGPPEEKGVPFGAVDCDIHYYLGPERGLFRIDSEWLFITFNKDGKVGRYWIYRD